MLAIVTELIQLVLKYVDPDAAKALIDSATARSTNAIGEVIEDARFGKKP